MKSHLRALSLILVISFALVWRVPHVYASSQYDSAPNPVAEDYLLNSLRVSGIANFESFPETERNISGESLVNALKDPQVQSHSFIYVANVTVVNAVQANDLVLPGSLDFYKVKFSDYVNFNSALLHALWMEESTFQSYVDFSLATFDGNIVMNNNTFQDLWFPQTEVNGSINLNANTFHLGTSFDGAHITQELLVNDSQFLGTEPLQGSPASVEFWTVDVDGVAEFINTHFAGKANFAQSEFYRLDMQGATFAQDADFSGIRVERSADLTNTNFSQLANFEDFSTESSAKFKGAIFNGEAIFENATFTRDVSFEKASFQGNADFDYVTVGRFCDFIDTKFNNKLSFTYASVAWPYFKDVAFNGPVTFEGTRASEDFEIETSSYNYSEEPFAVNSVTVGGAVKFTDFLTPTGLQLSRSHFNSLHVEAKEKLKTEFIDIHETSIENELTITNISMKSLMADGATIGKSTNLSKVSITEELDMRNTSIGFLKMDQQIQWPTNPDHFNLRGMVYTDIDIGNKGLTEENFRALLGLVNHSAYTPQAYESLSQFLTDKGHPDWAAEVELNQKRRERQEVLTRFSGAWFWSWFLDIFAGYGHRPVFAFIWSGLVIAMGALVFRRKENMLPIDQGDAKVEYNPLWYSFALFLPYIDLGIASKWEPDPCRKWARNYKYIHMMLGWVLAPIALLTFSGIIG